MKRFVLAFTVACLTLCWASNICVAQMYQVTELGTLGGQWSSAAGINFFGQVTGSSGLPDFAGHAFRTKPLRPINPSTDDVGTFGATGKGDHSEGYAVNAFGRVVGGSFITYGAKFHAFRTAPNRPINLATDDLGTLGGDFSSARGISDFGQVVGYSMLNSGVAPHAFRTGFNKKINPVTDDLGTLGGILSQASGVNLFGQVVGISSLSGDTVYHAFRTRSNRKINPATDDLGTLGGSASSASHINLFGQVVGTASLPGDTQSHAFRTAPNRSINPATDDLGTLGGTQSSAASVNDFGQVVGAANLAGDTAAHAFLYSGHTMHDLNALIAPGSGCVLVNVVDINDAGLIAANANCGSQSEAVLLTPVYRAFVKQPVDAEGLSIFSARRGTIPLKFALTKNGAPTCDLPQAGIAITRATFSALDAIDENAYAAPDDGTDFRIDAAGCQYHYNLKPAGLGKGLYRVDVSIEGIVVGHAVFALR